jgi:hypothetical protein
MTAAMMASHSPATIPVFATNQDGRMKQEATGPKALIVFPHILHTCTPLLEFSHTGKASILANGFNVLMFSSSFIMFVHWSLNEFHCVQNIIIHQVIQGWNQSMT